MGLPTEEGNKAVFSVSLAEAPLQDVTLALTVSDASIASLGLDTITFTVAGWAEPVLVTVYGFDDEVDDGDAEFFVDITVTAGDEAYLALQRETVAARVLDDEETLVIRSGPSSCDGPATEDAYSGTIVDTIYDRNHPSAQGLAFDAGNPEEDDVAYAETADIAFLSVRALHVIMTDTAGMQMDDDGVAAISAHYATAAHQVRIASGALFALDYAQVVIDDTYDATAFIDESLTGGGGFQAYGDLRDDLVDAGYDVDDFDLVSISLANSFTAVAPSLAYVSAYASGATGGQAFTNPTTWANDRTRTTVQYVQDPLSPGWVDIFMHEWNHIVEFEMHDSVYPEHRNADDAWWLATYPSYVFGSPGFADTDVLTMFWARPKAHLLELDGIFGDVVKGPATHVVETSCPERDTLQMRRVYCEYGVSCEGEGDRISCACDRDEDDRGEEGVVAGGGPDCSLGTAKRSSAAPWLSALGVAGFVGVRRRRAKTAR